MTVYVAAKLAIIDAIAVADIEAVLRAIPPDCVLDEPGKRLRELGVELPGIDPVGHSLDNVGAAARPIAGDPVGMVGLKSAQDPGPDQEVVNQGIDGDHAGADLVPKPPLGRSGDQDE